LTRALKFSWRQARDRDPQAGRLGCDRLRQRNRCPSTSRGAGRPGRQHRRRGRVRCRLLVGVLEGWPVEKCVRFAATAAGFTLAGVVDPAPSLSKSDRGDPGQLRGAPTWVLLALRGHWTARRATARLYGSPGLPARGSAQANGHRPGPDSPVPPKRWPLQGQVELDRGRGVSRPALVLLLQSAGRGASGNGEPCRRSSES